MPRRVLLLLSQLPQDPASGAARSVKNIGELLARAGFEVECLGTTASEHRAPDDPIDALARAGVLDPAALDPAARVEGGVIRFRAAGVACTLLHTGAARILEWSEALDERLDALLDESLARFRPEVLFTFGGQPRELRRQAAARDRGCAVVFALMNWGYLTPGAIPFRDAVWTVSNYQARVYRERAGIDSIVIPNPILPEEVLVPEDERRPCYVTFINPSPEKGVMLFARLAEEIARTRPDVPFLVVDARGTAHDLVRAGLDAGFDLRRHASIVNSPGAPRPSAIFKVTKILLAPSVLAEPSGRVAAEALINAVPPVVSDRGGLPETVGEGGVILPLPGWLRADSRRVVSAEEARPWVEAVLRLHDDAAAYAQASARARAAAAAHMPDAVAPRFVELFESVRRA